MKNNYISIYVKIILNAFILFILIAFSAENIKIIKANEIIAIKNNCLLLFFFIFCIFYA